MASSRDSPRPEFAPEPAFKWVQPPNKDWKAGQKFDESGTSAIAAEWAKGASAGYQTFLPEKEKPQDIYRLMISGIIPRPVAFVSSLAPDGTPNLAPFSYFSMVCHNPPLVSVSFTHSRTRQKDSSVNIRQTKQFTVNIISEPWVEGANWTSTDAPVEVEEWIGSGLTKVESTFVKPPRVGESAFSMECELFSLQDISPPDDPDFVSGTLVLGHVKAIHVRKDIWVDDGKGIGMMDPVKFRAVSRLGGTTFARVGEGFELPRPVWSEVSEEVAKLKQK
ncbi:flavin reductase-like domain protein [Ceratobasidium sp. AG-Ba]|nr:flavin reductase-like domain protein [Ceratobasidium sp. AG-Ba]